MTSCISAAKSLAQVHPRQFINEMHVTSFIQPKKVLYAFHLTSYSQPKKQLRQIADKKNNGNLFFDKVSIKNKCHYSICIQLYI